MVGTISLNEREQELLAELLEAERNELPVEIRRTGKQSYHDQLRQRMEMVEDLLKRLRQPVESA